MPKILRPEPLDKWEKEVLKVFVKQLPDDWVVICQVHYHWKDDKNYLRDGEADFVVLVPDMGLVVVEVKGTQKIWIDEADGCWYRVYSDRKERIDESPPEQAKRNMYNLKNIASKGMGEKHFPGLYGWVVVYPNGVIEGSLDTFEKGSVITRDNIRNCKSIIRNALEKRGSEGLGNNFRSALVKSTSEILTNGRFIVTAADTDVEVEEDSDSIDRLTRQQYATLRGIFELNSVSVTGPAGSGKTILAIWKLQSLIESGKKAMYVCYNKALAEYLQLKYEDISEYIIHVDKLFMRIANARVDQNDALFFQKTLPELVANAEFNMDDEEKFDAFIVDEGQDFGSDRLLALRLLLHEDDEKYQWLVFSDEKQNLYQDGQDSNIEADATFRLHHNCRNTESINNATNGVCELEVRSLPGVPEGVMPTVHFSNNANMGQRAWELVNKLSANGDVAILSPRKLKNSCMSDNQNAYGLRLTEDIRLLDHPEYVYFSTIKSFKGLEASHIIFVDADLPRKDTGLEEEDVYVAFTRATARLDIITSKQDVANEYEKMLTNYK